VSRELEDALEELELENAEADILEAELEDASDDEELELLARRMSDHLARAEQCAQRIRQLIQEL